MPEISGNDLVMVIQAVDDQIHRLKYQLDNDSEEDGRDIEELLFSYMNTASHLEQAYQQALQESCNLPAYDRLVKPLDVD